MAFTLSQIHIGLVERGPETPRFAPMVATSWGLPGAAECANPSPLGRETNAQITRWEFFMYSLRRVISTPDPDTFEKYRDTPPISIAIL